MAYPRNLLNDNETLALDLNPHWWFWAKAVLGMAAFAVGGIIVRVLLSGWIESALTWVAIAGIIASALFLIERYARWTTTNFAVTNHRVIYRSGVLRKQGVEIPIERVNNVLSKQGVFERLIGAGDLLIESGGESGQQHFTDIKNPSRVKNIIHAQREGSKARGSGTVDVASQLEKLEGMLQRGTLTQQEFDAEKRRLLD